MLRPSPAFLSNRTVSAHLSLIGANLIFGLTYAIVKQVVPDFISPFSLVFTRILGACILFWLTGIFIAHERIDRRDVLRVFLASLFGVAGNQSLFIHGLSMTSPIDSAILMTATPILVLIIARILLKEPVTLFKIAGIAAGAAGALLLIYYSGNTRIGSGDPLGNALMIGNATCFAIYLVIVKPLLVKYHPVTIMKWIFLSGLLLVSGPGLPAFLKVEWTALPTEILLSVLYIVVGTTYLAYLLNNYSLKYVKPITVSIYDYSHPVIASIMAVLMGQDVITTVKILSAILVFTGVYFVSYSSSRTGRK